jgi:hypothetical protein
MKVETSHCAWRLNPDNPEADLVRNEGHTLLTTLNGYQWAGLSTMTLDELEVLNAFLTDYIRENKT